MSELAFIGLLAPILSMFLSRTSTESAIWCFLFWLGNTVVHILQVKGGILPPSPLASKYISWSNNLTVMYLSAMYVIIFWFVVHVYTAEVEARQSLQKELHLFMRLSHEIRTPVTIIGGLADLMLEWATLDFEQKRNVSDLATASRRLQSIVNDLLTFSGNPGKDGVSSGGDNDEAVQFNLREVVDLVVGYHLPHAEHCKVAIYIDVPSDIPLHVVGAKSRLISVLDHLVSNAVKFTASGSVTIEIGLVDATSDSSIREFRFSVRDTGAGMTSEEIDIGFQPFAQMDINSNTNEFTGVGLGLPVVERLLKQWNRSMEVRSEGHGLGSTFSFSVPFRLSDGAVHGIARPFARCAITVFVIDEDPMSLKGMVQTCEMLGVKAEDGHLEDLTEDRVSSIDAVVIVFPSNVTADSVVLSVQHVRAVSSSLTLLVSGPSGLQATIGTHGRSHHACTYIRNPPSVGQLKSALRHLVQVPMSQSRSMVGFRTEGPAHAASISSFPSDHMTNSPPHSSSSRNLCDAMDRTTTITTRTSSSLPVVSDNPFPPPTSMSSVVVMMKEAATLPVSPRMVVPSSPRFDGRRTEVPTIMAPASPRASSLQARILCVDDSEVILRLLAAFIQRAGFTGLIDTACNGEEAVRMVTQHDYRLIFMDFHMPKLNGAEATIQIRQGGFTMPIVGVTAAPNVREVCVQAGMNDVVFKPFTRAVIEELIKTYQLTHL